jgi:hypothetical protein
MNTLNPVYIVIVCWVCSEAEAVGAKQVSTLINLNHDKIMMVGFAVIWKPN